MTVPAERRSHLSRQLIGFLGASLAVASIAVPAEAKTARTPDGSAAISQYVEVVPTAGGGVGSGSSGTPGVLSNKARRAVLARGGADAKLLLKVATSPAYGAPRASRPGRPSPFPTSPGAGSAAVGALNTPAVAGIVAACAVVSLVVLCFRAARAPRVAATPLQSQPKTHRV